jgi:glycosyltransferase involved in cell wall biosynthesis
MPGITNKLTFVVPTKDRPDELLRLLKSLETQTAPPDEIIVVDGSAEPLQEVVEACPGLRVRTLRCVPPSATRQRNAGIQAVRQDQGLIGILDDDSVLAPDACEEMLRFWERASAEIGGASFNLVNHPPLFASGLKHLGLAERLGLYSGTQGRVLPSGFQVMLANLEENTAVEWLPSGTSVWRREVFHDFRFDEWYAGYSYLEDLDFSYQVGKKYRLVVVAAARQFHYPSPRGRMNGYRFGQREVENRLHFVKKHKELSRSRCYLALVVRAVISLVMAVKERNETYVHRSAGNVVGLVKSLV